MDSTLIGIFMNFLTLYFFSKEGGQENVRLSNKNKI